MRKAVLWAACAGILWHIAAQQSYAQKRFCATTEEVIPWLRRFQQNPPLTQRSNELLYVPVAVHLVGTDTGTDFIPAGKVLDAFCTLNQHFAQAGIQFFLSGSIRFISNSSYQDHLSGWTGLEMMKRHNVPGAVNTYFVANAAEACGYTLRETGGWAVGIALSDECVGLNFSTWVHEMGHFLSLPHTFHGWENVSHNFNTPAPLVVQGVPVELANGSNCSTSGDGFCDTPADYLNGRWFCNAQSASPITQRDPNGAVFQSDGSLFMSYAADPCPTRFSPTQRAAMRTYLQEVRRDVLHTGLSLDVIPREDIQLLFPDAAFFIPTFQEVFLRWKQVQSASGYLVELSQIPTFAFITNTYATVDTSIMIKDLKPGRTYYWRIRPFNTLSACRLYSPIRSFVTGAVTTPARVLEEDHQIRVFPNPVAANTPFILQFHSPETARITYRIEDLSGRLHLQGVWQATSGDNRLPIPQSPSAPGIYLLRILYKDTSLTRKIMVAPSP